MDEQSWAHSRHRSAFSAGNDLYVMQARINDPNFARGAFGFRRLIQALTDLSKPLLCAVNGLAVGIGTTILGYADLVVMAETARLLIVGRGRECRRPGGNRRGR